MDTRVRTVLVVGAVAWAFTSLAILYTISENITALKQDVSELTNPYTGIGSDLSATRGDVQGLRRDLSSIESELQQIHRELGFIRINTMFR